MTSVWAAGQTIIEDKYRVLAESKKSLRQWNNTAVFFTTLFVAARLGFNAPSETNKLEERETYTVMLEFATWILFLFGLGLGQARREKDWLLRTAMLLAGGSLAAQVVAMGPSRIREIMDAAQLAATDQRAKVRFFGGLLQVGAMGARMVAISMCAKYLTTKRAAAEQRRPAADSGPTDAVEAAAAKKPGTAVRRR